MTKEEKFLLTEKKWKIRFRWLGKDTLGLCAYDGGEEGGTIYINIPLFIASTLIHEYKHSTMVDTKLSAEDEEILVLKYEAMRVKTLSAKALQRIAKLVLEGDRERTRPKKNH
jgi:hypothetical protein